MMLLIVEVIVEESVIKTEVILTTLKKICNPELSSPFNHKTKKKH